MGIFVKLINPGAEGMAVIRVDGVELRLPADDVRHLYYKVLGLKGEYNKTIKEIVDSVTLASRVDIDVPEDILRAERYLELERSWRTTRSSTTD